jgi:hypothetical protein
VPFPLPLAPPVIVIQDVEVDAVHEQPDPAVTATVFVCATSVMVALVGVIAKLHAVAAAWVTVTVTPATVSVPVREEVPVLAATE